jgi:ABC-type branched-subunit amino acid transport system ATPase component/ABC-type uncharacterized transport system permease subunit
LGFSIILEQVFFRKDFMFGPTTLGVKEPRPNVSIGSWDMATDKGFYYVLLIITVLVVLLITIISRGRLGRLLEAMADSTLALETHGTTSSVLKVIVFCIVAAMAAVAGALTGMLYHYGVGTYFSTFNSMILVALVIIMTVGEPWYAVIAAIGLAIIPGYLHGNTTPNLLNLLFGLGACAAAYAVKMSGAPEGARRFFDRLGGRRPALAIDGATPIAPTKVPEPRTVTPPSTATARTDHAAASDGLEVRALSVRFGGVVAVNDVSLRAPMGVITGLIGPNGAGKTTIFNACTGLVRPTNGRVFIHGADATRAGSPQRARMGLGRTFQRTELFNSLTVAQNISMGREAAIAGWNPVRQLYASRSARKAVDAATQESLELTGTTAIANLQAGLLPIGQRRLVELARVLAGPFDILLLDEPSSGLDEHETEQFGDVLKAVVRERSCSILVVEHDMTLVRDICDYVYVLDFGVQIFQGTPEAMHDSAAVRAAYLGDVGTPTHSVSAEAAPC